MDATSLQTSMEIGHDSVTYEGLSSVITRKDDRHLRVPATYLE